MSYGKALIMVYVVANYADALRLRTTHTTGLSGPCWHVELTVLDVNLHMVF